MGFQFLVKLYIDMCKTDLYCRNKSVRMEETFISKTTFSQGYITAIELRVKDFACNTDFVASILDIPKYFLQY
jgi:hypothetical protein